MFYKSNLEKFSKRIFKTLTIEQMEKFEIFTEMGMWAILERLQGGSSNVALANIPSSWISYMWANWIDEDLRKLKDETNLHDQFLLFCEIFMYSIRLPDDKKVDSANFTNGDDLR